MTFTTKILLPEWCALTVLSRIREYAAVTELTRDDLEAVLVGLMFLIFLTLIYRILS
jgi:hypothetical protein